MKDHSNMLAAQATHGSGGEGGKFLALKSDGGIGEEACRWGGEETWHGHSGGRFTATRFPDHADNLALLKGEAEVIDSSNSAVVGIKTDGEVTDLQ